MPLSLKDLLRDFWGWSDGHQSNEFDPCIQPHHAGCVRVTWTTRRIISKTYFLGEIKLTMQIYGEFWQDFHLIHLNTALFELVENIVTPVHMWICQKV